MYLKEFLQKFEESKLKLFVDMDGVIADYNVGEACNYHMKRPLKDSILKLKEVSEMKNVELYILSISRMNEGVEQKNIWLDMHAPFFKENNRIIIPREANNFEKSPILKAEYLKNIQRDNAKIIMIDDDPAVIKEIRNRNNDVILLKDTVLVD